MERVEFKKSQLYIQFIKIHLPNCWFCSDLKLDAMHTKNNKKEIIALINLVR